MNGCCSADSTQLAMGSRAPCSKFPWKLSVQVWSSDNYPVTELPYVNYNSIIMWSSKLSQKSSVQAIILSNHRTSLCDNNSIIMHYYIIICHQCRQLFCQITGLPYVTIIALLCGLGKQQPTVYKQQQETHRAVLRTYLLSDLHTVYNAKCYYVKYNSAIVFKIWFYLIN